MLNVIKVKLLSERTSGVPPVIFESLGPQVIQQSNRKLGPGTLSLKQQYITKSIIGQNLVVRSIFKGVGDQMTLPFNPRQWKVTSWSKYWSWFNTAKAGKEVTSVSTLGRAESKWIIREWKVAAGCIVPVSGKGRARQSLLLWRSNRLLFAV